jgi:hypothetical protein
VGPIAGADVIVCAVLESTCGREKTIDRADGETRFIPTQNEWLIIRIGKTAPAAGEAGSATPTVAQNDSTMMNSVVKAIPDQHFSEQVQVDQSLCAVQNEVYKCALTEAFFRET